MKANIPVSTSSPVEIKPWNSLSPAAQRVLLNLEEKLATDVDDITDMDALYKWVNAPNALSMRKIRRTVVLRVTGKLIPIEEEEKPKSKKRK